MKFLEHLLGEEFYIQDTFNFEGNKNNIKFVFFVWIRTSDQFTNSYDQQTSLGIGTKLAFDYKYPFESVQSFLEWSNEYSD